MSKLIIEGEIYNLKAHILILLFSSLSGWMQYTQLFAFESRCSFKY